ncbi:MAG: glycosyltransferase family 4 protein [Altibacter sp.]|uniref:glycosyltransferase family 4 protein n=1 Tax=Altibacter sp. TaxID=2024823 RepID=UPI001D911258|nr:glycosyltransferase family 4 protein [Altibacter sp.]MBZ0328620.1 glycosyltransferase family 4 protein [Altibacter sp.]
MKKRALIITYYWPPAGGPGVQRWLNFVKYLGEFDIEPVVYIPENPHYPLVDTTFISVVPEGIELIKHPIKEPYRLAALFSKKKTQQISSGIITKKKPSLLEKVLLYIRGNYFIPDARIGWVQPSVRFLQDYLKVHPVDVVITTGPPHSLHLIGLKLKEIVKIPWVADFRDPWTTIHYHNSLRLTVASERKHKKLEAQVLQNADRVVVTSPTTKKEFEIITDAPIAVITNGYGDTANDIVPNFDKRFSIAHIGSLLSERNPKVLWKVLSEIASENDTFKKDLQLKFAGAVSEDVLASIDSFQLRENLEVIGYVSHSEAIQLQHNAQLLLLVEMNKPETRAIIPGKLFEYLVARRPIIAFGPQGSDMAGIISETKSGHFFGYHNEEALASQILEYYALFKADALYLGPSEINQYSRRELTKKLAAVLHELS